MSRCIIYYFYMNIDKKQRAEFIPLEEKHLLFRKKWFCNLETNKFLGSMAKENQTTEAQNKWYESYKDNPKSQFYIMERNNTPFGLIGLTHINKIDKNASIGLIMIGEQNYVGKGYGREAMLFIISKAFNDLGLHKLYLYVHAENDSAIKCYKSVGFKIEGVAKDMEFDGKIYHDKLLMGLVNSK